MNTRRRQAIAGPRDRRGGFTLVELLIVIMIISILTGLTLVVLRSAQDDASEARTRTQIERIKGLIMDRLETYQTRIIPMALDPSTNPQPMDYRDFRRRVIAELIRVEIPFDAGNLVGQEFDGEAVDDTQFPRNSGTYVLPSSGAAAFDWANFPKPTLLLGYKNYFSPYVPFWTAPTPDSGDDGNVPAELLYAVLKTLVDTDGRSGLDYLRPSEIGDTDDDGCLEVLDGWGVPFVSFYIRSSDTLMPLDPTTPEALDRYEIVIESETLSNRIVPP